MTTTLSTSEKERLESVEKTLEQLQGAFAEQEKRFEKLESMLSAIVARFDALGGAPPTTADPPSAADPRTAQLPASSSASAAHPPCADSHKPSTSSDSPGDQLLKKCLDEGTNLDQFHMGPSFDSIENSPSLEVSPVSHTKGLLRVSSPKGSRSAIPCEISTSREVHQDSAALSPFSESVGTTEAPEMRAFSDLKFSLDTRVVLPLDEARSHPPSGFPPWGQGCFDGGGN